MDCFSGGYKLVNPHALVEIKKIKIWLREQRLLAEVKILIKLPLKEISEIMRLESSINV